jgi:hypothetical protein
VLFIGQGDIAKVRADCKPIIFVSYTFTGRLAGNGKRMINRGKNKSLDKGARKWCSRLDENQIGRATREL